MINYQELVDEITNQLSHDDNVQALILYGSVSRNEQKENSDIDLLVIINDDYLQKRHEIRKGITIEYVEMNIRFLENFIDTYEIPMIFTLAKGKVLFDKKSILNELISESKKIINDGPPENTRWQKESYRTKKRSDLTEIYLDLLDVDDEVEFNYIANFLISTSIQIILENKRLWNQTRKKMIGFLKVNCSEVYQYISILLKGTSSIKEKRIAAQGLTEYALKPHGGILEGEAIIFKKTDI